MNYKISYEKNPKSEDIHWVDESLRGNGYGTQLMQKAEHLKRMKT